MTPEAALTELFDRIAARQGAITILSDYELNSWPERLVIEMKSHGLLTKACPAKSAVCPGCESECVMPVEVCNKGDKLTAFIVCNRRSDINRVLVPISHLERWQTSGDFIANFLAKLLGLQRLAEDYKVNAARFEVGLFKGTRYSSHLVLTIDGKLTLSLAGHSTLLADILMFEGHNFKVDRRTLNRLVDQPVASAGSVESAAQRRERLEKHVRELKQKGVNAFLKITSAEEGISVPRLKQILKPKN